MLWHCQIQTEKNASDADGSDSPGNFIGPSLLWLSVFLSPSELSGKLKCQSQISALPAVYTKPLSTAFRGLGTCYVQYVWLDSGVQNWNRIGCSQCWAEIGSQFKWQRCPCQFNWDSGCSAHFLKPILLLGWLLLLFFFLSFLSFVHLTSSPTSCFFLFFQWKEWNLCDRHFQIKIIINFLPTSSVIFGSAREETRIGCVHWS